VARVQGADGTVRPVSAVSGPKGHAEESILDKLNADDKILELYSERQPCPDICGPLLRNDPRAASASVTYSVPYFTNKTRAGKLMNSVSRDMLSDMIRRAKGF
jgi:hypothetical protein